MNKILLTILYFPILAVSVFAVPIQDANIRGYVNVDGVPTANIKIVAKINDVNVGEANTDANGYYSVNIPYPNYNGGETVVLFAETDNNEGSIEITNLQAGNNGLYNNISITTESDIVQLASSDENGGNAETEEEEVATGGGSSSNNHLSSTPSTQKESVDNQSVTEKQEVQLTKPITSDLPPEVKEDAIKTAEENGVVVSPTPTETSTFSIGKIAIVVLALIVLALFIFKNKIYRRNKNEVK